MCSVLSVLIGVKKAPLRAGYCGPVIQFGIIDLITLSFQLNHDIKSNMGKKKILRHLSYFSKSNLSLNEKLSPDDVIATSSPPVGSLGPSQGLLARTWKTSLRVCCFGHVNL